MTTMSMGSNNGDDAANLQHQPAQRIPSSSQRQQPRNPDNFVFGSRTGQSRWDDDQRHTLNGIHRPAETDTDVQLLHHLSNDFAQLLNRTDISDCLLNVRGTYMAVHRCILAARSSTFAAVMSGNVSRLDTSTRDQLKTTTEKDRLVISVDKTDPEIMKQVIIYMYTAKCELHERNAYALLDASGRYDIKSLKVHTGRYLVNHIDANNVLMLIKAAYKYDNVLIKQKCIEYFIEHAKEIMDIAELWKVFAEEHPSIVAELLYWSVNKEEFRNNLPQSDLYS